MYAPALLTALFATLATAITPSGNVQPFQLVPWDAPSTVSTSALQFTTNGSVGFFPSDSSATSLIGLTQKGGAIGAVFITSGPQSGSPELYLDQNNYLNVGNYTSILALQRTYGSDKIRFEDFRLGDFQPCYSRRRFGYDDIVDAPWAVDDAGKVYFKGEGQGWDLRVQYTGIQYAY
jgi:hypothetical protein